MNTLSELYHSDFNAWALQTAALIRQRAFDDLNLNDLAEEIESLGDKERREVARNDCGRLSSRRN